jgi:hypothetical protein
MNVITSIIDKSMFILFFMSLFIVGRHVFLFSRHLNKPEADRYAINKKALIYFGVALSFLLMTIFKGISI